MTAIYLLSATELALAIRNQPIRAVDASFESIDQYGDRLISFEAIAKRGD